MKIRPITNAVSLAANSNVFGATSVLVVNTGTTDRTLTIANTQSAASGGGQYGIPAGNASQATITLVGVKGTSMIINKKPTDVIDGGHVEVKGTGIASSGEQQMKLITEVYDQDIQFITEAKEDCGKNYFIEGVFMQGDIKNRNGRIYPM